MATAGAHMQKVSGEYIADLMVNLAMARARVDELEQENARLKQTPAVTPAQEPA